MDSIICPKCGERVEVSKALKHEIEDKIRTEEKLKAKEEFEKEKIKTEKILEEKLRLEFATEQKTAAQTAQNALKKQKELEEKLERTEKEAKEKEEKIRMDAFKEVSDKARLEKLEFEKKISDMQKALEVAQRKGKQGSQQLQGDVLEQDLEQRLREAFPYDVFKPVPTGIRGGDIIQEIRNKFGNVAGIILWEAKRQKAWQKIWTGKLKDDMRKINASDCILVTDILPANVKMYDRVDNVWVTSYEYVIKLTFVLREGIMKVAIAKKSASHTDEELRELYRIITSDSFRNKFEARDEIISVMRKDLESDKASTERRWKRQEVYIEKLARNNHQLYGELQAHLPSLKSLNSEILELEDDTQKNLPDET